MQRRTPSCGEYEGRNAHYRDWINWYKENPGGAEQLVAFATEHSGWFSASRDWLEKIDAALSRWEQLSGISGIRDGIRPILEAVSADAPRLGQNLEVLKASASSGQHTKEGAQVPQILPQKRPRTDLSQSLPASAVAATGAVGPQH